MKSGTRKKLHYSWIVAAVTFFILLLGAGVRAAPSVLILPLQREFGWDTSTISAAIAVNIFLFGMMGPFAVAIMERFGIRRTISVALLVLAIGVALTAFMTQSWQMMLLWGFVVGSGTGVVAMSFGVAITERWFTKSRGLVLGILTASNATGQLIFLPLLASVAVNSGWRTVSLGLAIVILLASPLAAFLLREYPADAGLAPFGSEEIQAAPTRGRNPAVRALLALQAGLRSGDFWLLSGSFFVCGASTNGLIGTHLIPACGDHGIPEVQAAGLLAMMGIFDLFGTTASGWLSDRWDSRKLLAWYYGLRGISLLILPYSFDFKFYGLSVFALVYGLDWVATVPPTVKLAGQIFGQENAAIMFGWIAAAHQVGAALAAWGAGLIRTGTGNYNQAFITSGLLCLVTAFAVSLIGKKALKHAGSPRKALA
jgi:sugar phosphate permease